VVQPLGSALGIDAASIGTAQEAAPLADADLATAMFMKFTSLAGIMGRHYALKGRLQHCSMNLLSRKLSGYICPYFVSLK
jgi:glycyl-tRNA synthetase beta subunit